MSLSDIPLSSFTISLLRETAKSGNLNFFKEISQLGLIDWFFLSDELVAIAEEHSQKEYSQVLRQLKKDYEAIDRLQSHPHFF